MNSHLFEQKQAKKKRSSLWEKRKMKKDEGG
jgi:hypothetical protein